MSSLAGATIYIYADSLWTTEPVFGELHVLDDTKDTLHYAGHHSQMRTITFWLLEPHDYDTIDEIYRAGSETTMVGWLDGSYTVVIKELAVQDILTDIKRGPDYSVVRARAKLLRIA